MTLNEYQQITGLDNAAFARLYGINRVTMLNYLKQPGEKGYRPTSDAVNKITELFMLLDLMVPAAMQSLINDARVKP